MVRSAQARGAGTPWGYVKALWMPCLLVGLPLAAAVLRMTSVTLRDAAGEEFLRTARTWRCS